jgi:GT2 family glycosyltransferase
MKTPAVSTVIPTYNRARLVARAAESVLAQSYANCHVVIVDDGSSDDTEKVLKDRFGSEPRVRYLRQKNAGVSAARNAGLAEAKGDYLAFLDSDDTWKPWKLEVQVACLERLRPEGVGMLWTDMDLVDAEGGLVKPNANRTSYGVYRLFRFDEMFSGSSSLSALVPGVTDPGKDTQVFWGDVYSYIAMGNLCPTPSVILTRERANLVGSFDESMRSGEDYSYHLKTCSFGPAAFLDIASFSYRKGAEDQLTAKGYELLIAENALKTIEATLHNHRERIRLPQSVIDDKLAVLHAWIGRMMLDGEDRSGARQHLRASLRLKPRQGRIWGMLAAASLPRALSDGLRASLRAAKRLRGKG